MEATAGEGILDASAQVEELIKANKTLAEEREALIAERAKLKEELENHKVQKVKLNQQLSEVSKQLEVANFEKAALNREVETLKDNQELKQVVDAKIRLEEQLMSTKEEYDRLQREVESEMRSRELQSNDAQRVYMEYEHNRHELAELQDRSERQRALIDQLTQEASRKKAAYDEEIIIMEARREMSTDYSERREREKGGQGDREIKRGDAPKPTSLKPSACSLDEVHPSVLALNVEETDSALADCDRLEAMVLQGASLPSAPASHTGNPAAFAADTSRTQEPGPQFGVTQSFRSEADALIAEFRAIKDLDRVLPAAYKTIENGKILRAKIKEMQRNRETPSYSSLDLQRDVGNLMINIQSFVHALKFSKLCKDMPVIISGLENFGKSLLLNCLAQMNITYSASKRATKCPVEYQLEHSEDDEELLCVVATSTEELEAKKSNPVDINEVPILVEAHMNSIKDIDRRKLYVYIRGRAVQYSGIFVDLPGLTIQTVVSAGSGEKAKRANASEERYKRIVQDIIRDALSESDEEGALVLCVEKFGVDRNSGYFLPMIKSILQELGNPRHRVIPVRTHHDMAYGWRYNSRADVERVYDDSIALANAESLAHFYALTKDANDEREFSYSLSLMGVRNDFSPEETASTLEANTQALVSSFEAVKPRMPRGVDLSGLDPRKLFSFNELRNEVNQHSLKEAFVTVDKFEALLNNKLAHISKIHTQMVAFFQKGTTNIKDILPDTFNFFWINYTRLSNGSYARGHVKLPVEFDTAPAKMQMLHARFPKKLNYVDPGLPPQMAGRSLADLLAIDQVGLTFPDNMEDIMKALLGASYSERYMNFDDAFIRMVDKFLTVISAIGFKPPPIPEIRSQGGRLGPQRSHGGQPEEGSKRIVTKSLQTLIHQVCCYMEEVMKCFFEQAIAQALWNATRSHDNTYCLLDRTSRCISLFRLQLKRASVAFVRFYINKLKADAFTFPHARQAEAAKKMEKFQSKLSTEIIKFLTTGETNLDLQGAKADLLDCVERTAEESGRRDSGDSGAGSTNGQFKTEMHSTPDVDPREGLTKNQRLTYDCMHLFHTMQMSFVLRVQEILRNQMYFHAFDQPDSDTLHVGLRNMMEHYVRMSVFTLKYKSPSSKLSTEQEDMDSDIEVVNNQNATEERLAKFYQYNVEAQRIRESAGELAHVLQYFPQQFR